MGARGVGHIAELCRIAPPDVAAVLNVGTAHLGEFGSREAIAQAKGEIVEALGPDGTAVLNAGDDPVVAMRDRTSAGVLTVRRARRRLLARGAARRPGQGVLRAGARRRVAPGLALAVRRPPGHQRGRRRGHGGRDRRRPRPLRPRADRRRGGLAMADGAARAGRRPGRGQRRLQRQPRVDGCRARRAGRDRRERAARARSRCSARCSSSATLTRTSTSVWAATPHGAVSTSSSPSASRRRTSRAVRPPYPAGSGVAVTTAGRDEALAWVRENASAADPGSWVVLVKASRGAALESVAEGLLHAVEEEEGSR